MSIIKAIRSQLGLSVTPANNFTLDASADNGTMKLARGNAGATTQDVMMVGGTGEVDFPQMARSIGASGHCKLPGGLIMQWGTATTNSSGTATTTFPTPFPNATLSVVCTRNGVSSASSTALSTGTKSASQFTAWNSTAATVSFDWFAIGY